MPWLRYSAVANLSSDAAKPSHDIKIPAAVIAEPVIVGLCPTASRPAAFCQSGAITQPQTGRYFLFNQKVLVMTALDARQLQAQYRQISAVQQLAALQQQQRIYLLTLTPGSFFQLFVQLQANPQLLSVEPDLALISKIQLIFS